MSEIEKKFKKLKSAIDSHVNADVYDNSNLINLINMKAGKTIVKNQSKSIFTWRIAWLALVGIIIAGIVFVVTQKAWLVKIIYRPIVVDARLETPPQSINGYSVNQKEFVLALAKPVKNLNNAVKVSPALKYSTRLSADKKKVIVKLEQSPIPGQRYKVALADTVVFEDNTRLSSSQTWTIPIEPVFNVTGISPMHGMVVPYDSAIEITFNSPDFDLESAKKHIKIIPAIKINYKKQGNKLILVPQDQLPLTSFKVIVEKGIKHTKYSNVTQSTLISKFKVANYSTSDLPMRRGIEIHFKKHLLVNHKGAYTMLTASGAPKTQLRIKIYKLTDKGLNATLVDYRKIRDIVTIPNDSKLVKDFTTTIDTEVGLPLKLDLEPGAYIIKASNSSAINLHTQQLVLIGDVQLYAETNSIENLTRVWAFNRQKLPFKNAQLSVLKCDDTKCQVQKTLKTDSNGFARLTPADFILYKGKLGYSVVPVGNGNKESQFLFDTKFNKPVYKQGEKLSFETILMEVTSTGALKPANVQNITVAICGQDCSDLKNAIQVKKIFADKNGRFYGEFETPSKRGDYYLAVYVHNKRVGIKAFNVIEYGKPQSDLTLNFDKEKYKYGETVTVSGQVLDNIGIGISNVDVHLRITAIGISPYVLNPTFDMIKNSWQFRSTTKKTIIEKTVRTGRYGDYKLQFKLNKGNNLRDYTVKLEATAEITDNSNNMYKRAKAFGTSGVDVVIVTDRDDYVEHDNAVITFQAVKPFKYNINPGYKFHLRVRRFWTEQKRSGQYYDPRTRTTKPRYETLYFNETVLEKDITVDSHGLYKLVMPNLKKGEYKFVLSDKSNRLEEISVFGVDQNTLDLPEQLNRYVEQLKVATATPVNVGAKFDIKVISNLVDKSKPLLITTYGPKLIKSTFVPGNTKILHAVATSGTIGGMQVCAIHPIDTSVKYKGKVLNVGYAINRACATIPVEDKTKKIVIQNVTIKSDNNNEQIHPGDTVKVRAIVKDDQGHPVVHAKVGVTVVDNALQRLPFNEDFWKDNLYAKMYQQYRNDFTVANYPENIWEKFYILTPYVGGVGGGRPDFNTIRRNFDDKAYWSASAITNNKGEVEFTFKLPDAVTTWTVKMWTFTDSGQVGSAYKNFKSTKKVYIYVKQPKVLRNGDKWFVPVRVYNSMQQTIKGKIILTYPNASQTRDITIPASRDVMQYIPIVVEPNQKLSIALKDMQGNVLDSVQFTPNVRPILAHQRYFTGAYKSGTDIGFTFNLPKETDIKQSSIKLRLTSGPALIGSANLLNIDIASTPQIAGAIFYLTDKSLQEQYYNQILKPRQADNGGFKWDEYHGVDIESSVAAGRALGHLTGVYSDGTKDRFIAYCKQQLFNTNATFSQRMIILNALSFVNTSEAEPFAVYYYHKVNLYNFSVQDLLNFAETFYNMKDTGRLTHVLAILNSKVKEDDTIEYLLGKTTDSSIFYTAKYAFLLSSIQDPAKDSDLRKILNWLQTQKVSGSNKDFNFFATMFYLRSIFENTKVHKVNAKVYVNNHQIYEGILDTQKGLDMSVDAKYIKNNNVVKVKLDKSVNMFLGVNGNLYGNFKPVLKQKPKIDMSYHNLSGSNDFKLGEVGYVQIKIKVTDNTPFTIIDYFPGGITLLSPWDDVVMQYRSKLAKFYKQKNVVSMIGNAYYNDYVSGHVSAETLKHYKEIILWYPFVVSQKGGFNGGFVDIVFENELNKRISMLKAPITVY